MRRDLKAETRSQPGRSRKARSGGRWATWAVAASVQITLGTTAIASASSAAVPKKKKGLTPPPAVPAPPTDMPSAGSGAEGLAGGDTSLTRSARTGCPGVLVRVVSHGVWLGAAAGCALALWLL